METAQTDHHHARAPRDEHPGMSRHAEMNAARPGKDHGPRSAQREIGSICHDCELRVSIGSLPRRIGSA